MVADRHERTEHYFAPRPATTSTPEIVDVVLPDIAFTMETDRGVFAHGRIDRGTSMLLRHRLALPAEGDLLDLGCGAGPIALTMAQRSPGAVVWAVDVNRRALELCRRNAERNGVENVRVADPDGVPRSTRFGAIWSNPPIRIGKTALHELLSTWLGRLEADAAAILVVQRHLGADSLQRWLGDRGHQVERLASKGGYRLIRVGAHRSSTGARACPSPR